MEHSCVLHNNTSSSYFYSGKLGMTKILEVSMEEIDANSARTRLDFIWNLWIVFVWEEFETFQGFCFSI